MHEIFFYQIRYESLHPKNITHMIIWLLSLTSFKNVFLSVCLITNLSHLTRKKHWPSTAPPVSPTGGLSLLGHLLNFKSQWTESFQDIHMLRETKDRIYNADANEWQKVDNGLIQRQWVHPMHLTHLLQQWHSWSDRTLQYVYGQPIMLWLPLSGQNNRSWPH